MWMWEGLRGDMWHGRTKTIGSQNWGNRHTSTALHLQKSVQTSANKFPSHTPVSLVDQGSPSLLWNLVAHTRPWGLDTPAKTGQILSARLNSWLPSTAKRQNSQVVSRKAANCLCLFFCRFAVVNVNAANYGKSWNEGGRTQKEQHGNICSLCLTIYQTLCARRLSSWQNQVTLRGELVELTTLHLPFRQVARFGDHTNFPDTERDWS